jgi:gliding motility-associated-like protein
VCEAAGTIDLSSTITGASGGSWSGTGVSGSTFDPTGLSGSVNVTYTTGSGSCTDDLTQAITVTPQSDPAWTTPGTICESDGSVNLDATITGDPGGTWSGTGVSGSNFDPTGLSGTISVTYTVGTSPCEEVSTQDITVTPAPGSPAWTTPGTVCEAAGTIDLSTTITGASGGTWSGTGVSGNTFDPTGLSGSVNVTYTTGSGSCTDELTQSITVTPQADPAWTSPGTVCESTGSIDLSTTITGDPGGTWSGTGVSGNNFDPSGLAGQSIDVTYTVGTAPCEESQMQTIIVETAVTASWTAPTDICETDAPIDLTPFVTGSTGGSWSGTGISGSNFDPSGLSGGITITYTVGSGSCTDTQDQTITVIDAPSDPTVSLDMDTICQGGTVEISASGSGTGITYNIYSDAQGNNFIGTAPLSVTPTSTTDYYVEAVNSNNCANGGGLQQVTVTVNPLPSVNAGADLTICAAESVTLNATGDGTLEWDTGDIGGQLVVSPSVTTTYTVTATDANGCSASDDVLVTVNTPAGTLDAVDDLFNVTTNQIGNYDILDNDTYTGISPSIVQNPGNGIASVQTDGTIDYGPGPDFVGTDTLTYEICDPQCVNFCDTAMVIFLVEEGDDIVIPGGFTPNGDNINETFEIEGLEEYPNNTLLILNRWGDVVYEATPYQNDWNGSSNSSKVLFGEKLPPGTYFYILDLGDGTNAFRGSLELKY